MVEGLGGFKSVRDGGKKRTARAGDGERERDEEEGEEECVGRSHTSSRVLLQKVKNVAQKTGESLTR